LNNHKYLVTPLLVLESVSEEILLGGLVSDCSSFSVISEVLVSLFKVESVLSRLENKTITVKNVCYYQNISGYLMFLTKIYSTQWQHESIKIKVQAS